MPHLSSHKISQKTKKEIQKNFTDLLASFHNNARDRSLIGEIFTETEQLMFAKRIAIVYLLEKGAPFNEIQKILKVSPSTIERFQNRLEHGAFKSLRNLMKDIDSRKRLGVLVEKVLNAGLPPRGRGRWTWLDDHF